MEQRTSLAQSPEDFAHLAEDAADALVTLKDCSPVALPRISPEIDDVVQELCSIATSLHEIGGDESDPDCYERFHVAATDIYTAKQVLRPILQSFFDAFATLRTQPLFTIVWRDLTQRAIDENGYSLVDSLAFIRAFLDNLAEFLGGREPYISPSVASRFRALVRAQAAATAAQRPRSRRWSLTPAPTGLYTSISFLPPLLTAYSTIAATNGTTSRDGAGETNT